MQKVRTHLPCNVRGGLLVECGLRLDIQLTGEGRCKAREDCEAENCDNTKFLGHGPVLSFIRI